MLDILNMELNQYTFYCDSIAIDIVISCNNCIVNIV